MGTPVVRIGGTFARRALVALAAALVGGTATAQERIAPLNSEPRPLTTVTAEFVPTPDNGIVQVQCSNCGVAPLNELPPPPPCDTCGGNCVAGGACQKCEATTGFGRLYCHFYNAFQCPDPCYQPSWVAGANASLFVDGARPATMMRFKWDSGRRWVLPDRNEFFLARTGGTQGLPNAETGLNSNELFFYTEAATGRFSAFTEMPYRAISTDNNGGKSGLADIIIGTKTLMIDTEYAQLTLQTKTFLPTGNSGKGLGTGHVSLEPSLILAAKLTSDTYFQGQIAEWIPFGGDSAVVGALLHYHGSLNHVIARPVVDTQFIATLEFQGYCFQDGAFTNAAGALQKSAGGHYFGIGPGFRWVMSQKCDFGFGVNFAVTSEHFAQQIYRSEFRVRF